METKFTPGPWDIEWGSIKIKSGPLTIADALYRDELNGAHTANAHLIAAAPELYEALEVFLAWMSADDASPDYHGLTRDTHPLGEQIWRTWWNANLDLCASAQEKARMALAKARGEK